MVYNQGFEKGRLQELANDFPHLAEPIQAILERIFDLLPIAREYYYHPDMRGSWSIKAVLPTIAPELDYADLPVSHGMMAMETFAILMQAEIDAELKKLLRQALYEYCERDTLAMVKIAHYFAQGNTNANA